MNQTDSSAGAGSQAPPVDLLVGRVLAERYRIIAKLGEGAMGAVYLGEHLRIGRRDAIKVLRDGLARDAEATARFTRGARNVSSIRHPNVCTIYDFSDTAEGLQYLAMEFIEGETLRDTLEREGRIELRRAVAIARQVADALQAAHEVGVVHRDLKPANIMLCPRPAGGDAVKVVDFDIAKGPGEAEGEEVTRVGFVVGTPEYMSPEQLTGDRLDGRSDVYSLAVVLFRMLTGVLPFRATSTQEIMVQRLTTDALTLSDVLPGGQFPPALQQVLARALARNAAHRQANAAEFARELEASVGLAAAPAAHSVAVSAPMAEIPATRVAAASSAPVVAPPARRLPVPVLVALGVAAIAVVGVGATVLLRDDPPPAAEQPLLQQTDAPPAAPPVTDAPPVVPPAGGTVVADPATGTARTTPRTPATPTPPALGNIDALLTRQFEALNGSPGAGALRAIRDTAQLAWAASTTRGDSAFAALVLAQAAFNARDDAACARWARRGAALDPSGFAVLLEACR